MRNRVAERFAPTELVELRAAAEATAPRTPKPFRSAYPGVSADVLPWLRAADTSRAALGMRRPVAPTAPAPRTDQSAQLLASRRTVRRVVAVYDALAADVEAMLTELAELAPFADAVKAGA